MLAEYTWYKSTVKLKCADCHKAKEGLHYYCTECTAKRIFGTHVVCPRCKKAHDTLHLLESLVA